MGKGIEHYLFIIDKIKCKKRERAREREREREELISKTLCYLPAKRIK